MNLINKISNYASSCPDRAAVRCGNLSLSYSELDIWSSRLALELQNICGDNKAPVAVYGHKHPFMLVCFLACVKSGRAYCPIDVSVPDSRTEMILEMLDSPVVLALSPVCADCGDKQVLSLEDVECVISKEQEIHGSQKELQPVSEDDIFYIIFTSGSTGTPKGVTITAGNLGCFLDWSVALGSSRQEKEGKVFLNQAPFSFDLSVMDMYTCLAVGGTLWCLTKEVQQDYRKLIPALKNSGAAVFVSTPSFADVCLSEPAFSQNNLPGLSLFLFCGETLTNRTARKLMERFPDADIFNTYGPTESTVAVTWTRVTREMADSDNPLPVGRAKAGTRIFIVDSEGKPLPDGEKGEIILTGDTVSPGYYKNPEQTEKHFFSYTENALQVRGYRTGDKGYMENGMLYYCGRMDLQIKLHGYRIELEDIENNLLRLSQVEKAAVMPNIRNGQTKSISAFLVCPGMTEPAQICSDKLKEKLRSFLPEYMIPKKFFFLDYLPMTGNGKIDRKALGSLKP